MFGKKRVCTLVVIGVPVLVVSAIAVWYSALYMIPVILTRGYTAIHVAAMEGDADRVRFLLDVMRMPVDTQGKDGVTPLLMAASRGQLETVRFLLDRGADVNAADMFGGGPISYAAYLGHVRVVKLLLDAGSEVDFQDRSTGVTPLHLALRQGEIEIAILLLRHGADPNVADSKGRRPLHYAVELRDEVEAITMARSLLEAGATTNVRNDRGMTPLALARRRGSDELVQLLREDGAEE